eukprot:gene4166-4484_t
MQSAIEQAGDHAKELELIREKVLEQELQANLKDIQKYVTLISSACQQNLEEEEDPLEQRLVALATMACCTVCIAEIIIDGHWDRENYTEFRDRCLHHISTDFKGLQQSISKCKTINRQANLPDLPEPLPLSVQQGQAATTHSKYPTKVKLLCKWETREGSAIHWEELT